MERLMRLLKILIDDSFFSPYLHIFFPDCPRIPYYNPQLGFAKGCGVNKEEQLWKSHQGTTHKPEQAATQFGRIRGMEKGGISKSLPSSPLPLCPWYHRARASAERHRSQAPMDSSPTLGSMHWSRMLGALLSLLLLAPPPKRARWWKHRDAFINLPRSLTNQEEGKNPGKYTSLSEIYTARWI